MQRRVREMKWAAKDRHDGSCDPRDELRRAASTAHVLTHHATEMKNAAEHRAAAKAHRTVAARHAAMAAGEDTTPGSGQEAADDE